MLKASDIIAVKPKQKIGKFITNFLLKSLQKVHNGKKS